MKNLKLNYRKTIGIGLTFFLITMFWQTYDGIIAKILIDKFGLDHFLSGVVMALDNVLAIFMLPLFGFLSDKTKTKLGKRTPYIIVGVLVASIAFVSMSFIDHKQTLKIEEANIKALYDETYDDIIKDTKRSYWDNIFYNEDFEYEDLVIRYKEVIYVDGVLKYQEDDIIGKFDQRTISDIYYDSLSYRAWELTRNDSKDLVIFILLLLIVLLAMSVFRSPAVALMPDVTLKPLRSKANAVINLMGSAGAVTSIAILTVFGLSKKSYVNYTPAFVITSVIMVLALIVFLFRVKENKFKEEYEKEVIEHNLSVVEEGSSKKLSNAEKKSMLLILLSVFLWYMGYNAVISKLSDYAPKILQIDFALPLLVAQGAAIISFIPIGMLSVKFGRRKMILTGVFILMLCFLGASFLTAGSGGLLYIILAFTGIAWATINVNSFPMAVELAKGSEVGKFTGYYYAFSMAAQIVTPILSGFVMNKLGRELLFPYATLFVILSFATMFFVKHGDVKLDKIDILETFNIED